MVLRMEWFHIHKLPKKNLVILFEFLVGLTSYIHYKVHNELFSKWFLLCSCSNKIPSGHSFEVFSVLKVLNFIFIMRVVVSILDLPPLNMSILCASMGENPNLVSNKDGYNKQGILKR